MFNATPLTAHDARGLMKSRSSVSAFTKQHFTKEIDKRISMCAKHGRKECYYTIPKYIIGKPLYDVGALSKSIAQGLVIRGFRVLCNDNILFVKW